MKITAKSGSSDSQSIHMLPRWVTLMAAEQSARVAYAAAGSTPLGVYLTREEARDPRKYWKAKSFSNSKSVE